MGPFQARRVPHGRLSIMTDFPQCVLYKERCLPPAYLPFVRRIQPTLGLYDATGTRAEAVASISDIPKPARHSTGVFILRINTAHFQPHVQGLQNTGFDCFYHLERCLRSGRAYWRRRLRTRSQDLDCANSALHRYIRDFERVRMELEAGLS